MLWLAVSGALAIVFMLSGRRAKRPRHDTLRRLGELEGTERRENGGGPGPLSLLLRWPYRISPPAVRRRLRAGLEGLEGGRLPAESLAACRAWLLAVLPAVLVLASRLSPAGFALAGVSAVSGLLMPAFLAARSRAARLRAVSSQLPQAADLLYAYVLGGRNLDQAVRSAAEETPGELGEILRQAVRETDLGASREEAFSHAVERCPLPELSGLLRSLALAESRGYPVSATLEVFSREIRLRRRDEVRSSVARAPLKMLVPLVFLILPASVLLTVGPTLLVTLGRLF